MYTVSQKNAIFMLFLYNSVKNVFDNDFDNFSVHRILKTFNIGFYTLVHHT